MWSRKEVLYINQVFKSLELDKQRRILDVAFEEFANHGYVKASTNRIIKKAGISKGTLFYYFNNKEELYHDLIFYGVNFIMEKYLLKIDEDETDFIEKYRMASTIKMKAYHENPPAFEFFGYIYLNRDDEPISKEAAEYLDKVRDEGFSRIYKNVDTSMFRKDIPPERVMKLIVRCMAGYEKEMTASLKAQDWIHMDFDVLLEEFYVFLEDLKNIFYNERR